MRKKKLEKLKQEIKKELQHDLEKKQSQPKVQKVQKEPVLHHSKEELQDIQKSFLKIFLFAVIVLLIAIIMLLVGSNSSEKESSVENEEVIEESNPGNENLTTFNEGVIENNNKYLLELLNEIEFNSAEFAIYDSTYLYSRDEFVTSDISEEYLLFMLSKTNEFKEYLQSIDLLTKVEICSKDGNIRIPVEKINELLELKFNVKIDKYSDFIYAHYVDRIFSTYIKFVYSDGYYISRCYDNKESFKYNSVSIQMLKDAEKIGATVKVRLKVAFATKDKIYADYGLQTIISEDIKQDELNYINKANEYEYVFNQKNNKYYLDKIVKLNQK